MIVVTVVPEQRSIGRGFLPDYHLIPIALDEKT